MAGEVKGLTELKRKFEEIPKALRRRVLRNALAAGGRIVRDEAKRGAPVLSSAMRAPYRRPGTLKNAIRVRTSKLDRRAGNVGVFVNVKPLNPGGAKNPLDPYYWRWLEFGWNPHRGAKGAAGRQTRRSARKLNKQGAGKTKAGIGYMKKAATKLGDALTAFETSIAKWMTSIDNGGQIQ